MRIVVTGATGTIGRLVVDRLLARGEHVRALTRHPDTASLPASVEVVGGDLTDPSSLPDPLFDGADRLFLFPATGGVEGAVERAVAAGVDRIVVLSSLAAAGEHERDLRSMSYRHHRAVEQAVARHTERWTFLRPGGFATNLLSWAPAIRAGAGVRAPYAASAQAPVHEADIADVAATVLTAPGHEGRTYALTGPAALTKAEQVEAIAAGLGRPVPFQEISPAEFRDSVRPFLPEDVVDMLLDHWADTVATPDAVHSGVRDLTGREARSLRRWAADHRAAFGAA